MVSPIAYDFGTLPPNAFYQAEVAGPDRATTVFVTYQLPADKISFTYSGVGNFLGSGWETMGLLVVDPVTGTTLATGNPRPSGGFGFPDHEALFVAGLGSRGGSFALAISGTRSFANMPAADFRVTVWVSPLPGAGLLFTGTLAGLLLARRADAATLRRTRPG